MLSVKLNCCIATENWTARSYNLSMESTGNDNLSCRSLLFPTNITVRWTDFLRIWASATADDNCTWPDLNTVGNCSSPRLELSIVDSDSNNVTVCGSCLFFWFPTFNGHIALLEFACKLIYIYIRLICYWVFTHLLTYKSLPYKPSSFVLTAIFRLKLPTGRPREYVFGGWGKGINTLSQ